MISYISFIILLIILSCSLVLLYYEKAIREDAAWLLVQEEV